MTELIKVENGISVLDAETSRKIAEFERQIKAIEEQEKALKEAIKTEMEQRGIIKLEDEVNGLNITYIGETMKETFNSKQFREDNPDMYDEYVKLSPCKAYIKIKVKEV